MYGKHFDTMYTGSMRGSGPLAFAVWGWVISHQLPNRSRTEFTVEIDVGLVAFQIGKVTEDEVRKQVDKFCSPDPKSRTEAEDGRKLVKINEYCYLVVNGAHYDQIRRLDERREYQRVKQAEYRDKKKKSGKSNHEPEGEVRGKEYWEAKSRLEGVQKELEKVRHRIPNGPLARPATEKEKALLESLRAQESELKKVLKLA